jgi:hypothetical protein
MQVDASEAAFRAWLTKNARNDVGRRHSPQDCAYARYLKDNGIADVRVGGNETMTMERVDGMSYIRRHHNPTWLQNFIAQFDDLGGHGVVLGAVALSYLEPEHVRERPVQKNNSQKQGHVEALPWGGALQSGGEMEGEDAPEYGSGGFDPGRPEFKYHYDPVYV